MISPKLSPSAVQISLLTATLVVSMVSLWWVLTNKRKKNFVHVGKVSKLLFFPVKSLKGIEVSTFDCVEKGVQVDGVDDRCYMIVGGDGFLCSQRQEPSLVLLTPSISKNGLCITGPGMEPLILDLKPSFSPNDKIIKCRIFEEDAPAIDCGDEHSAWFQKYLGRSDVRLVYTAEGVEKRKCIRDNPFLKKFRAHCITSFQDLSPFHVVTQASLDELNTRLEETKVSVHNFRPNILIEGCSAYDEDKWRFIKFPSGAEIAHIIPTGRCVLTTNDPETGVKTNKEPLVTLRKFRAPTDKTLKTVLSSAPAFGVNCKLVQKGKVAVGDDVFAVVEHKPFKY